MKKMIFLAAVACALPLAGCNKSPSEKLAGRVENAADARADTMENQASMLKQQADEVRDAGEERADAIKAADRNVSEMSQEQRDAIVANQSAAVR